MDPGLFACVATGILALAVGGIGWRELRWEKIGEDKEGGVVLKRRRNFGHPIDANFDLSGRMTSDGARSAPQSRK